MYFYTLLASFSELFVNEDCEAKCIIKAKASFQESSARREPSHVYGPKSRVILFAPETTFQGQVTLLHQNPAVPRGPGPAK